MMKRISKVMFDGVTVTMSFVDGTDVTYTQEDQPRPSKRRGTPYPMYDTNGPWIVFDDTSVGKLEELFAKGMVEPDKKKEVNMPNPHQSEPGQAVEVGVGASSGA